MQRQLASGKYQTEIEVLVAGAKLLEQQEDIYQGQLQALQQEALIGWQAAQRGEISGLHPNGTNSCQPAFSSCCQVMTAKFRLTETATRDIEQISDYIASEFGLLKAIYFQQQAIWP